ncbi:MAG: hypothetical protein ROZ00_00015 [Denitratisoma sp.]|nr:hypothetical protein [Denitratisoma sp.]
MIFADLQVQRAAEGVELERLSQANEGVEFSTFAAIGIADFDLGVIACSSYDICNTDRAVGEFKGKPPLSFPRLKQILS